MKKTSVGNAHCRQAAMVKFPRRDVPISIMSPYSSPFSLQPSCLSQQLVRPCAQPGLRVHVRLDEAVHSWFSPSICNLTDSSSVLHVGLLIAEGKHFQFLLFSSWSCITIQYSVLGWKGKELTKLELQLGAKKKRKWNENQVCLTAIWKVPPYPQPSHLVFRS